MKKFIIFLLLSPIFVKSQTLCLQTMCNAVKVRVGDTAMIGGVLTASNGYAAMSFKLMSGPNVPLTKLGSTPITGVSSGQQNMAVTGLVSGTYLYQLTGTDLKGGLVVGVDSIIVSAACPICPAPRTVTSLRIMINGQLMSIPLVGTKVTYSDGTIQQY